MVLAQPQDQVEDTAPQCEGEGAISEALLGIQPSPWAPGGRLVMAPPSTGYCSSLFQKTTIEVHGRLAIVVRLIDCCSSLAPCLSNEFPVHHSTGAHWPARRSGYQRCSPDPMGI